MARINKGQAGKSAVTLQTIARHLGLAPCSVSAVLNDSPAARRIPQRTKNRVLRAATKLNYRPNFSARALRTRRTHLVAVVTDDLSSPAVGPLICGVERELRARGYVLVLSGGGQDPRALGRRIGVEGVIVIDGDWIEADGVPGVSLWSHDRSGLMGGEELAELGAGAARAMVGRIEDLVRDSDTRDSDARDRDPKSRDTNDRDTRMGEARLTRNSSRCPARRLEKARAA